MWVHRVLNGKKLDPETDDDWTTTEHTKCFDLGHFLRFVADCVENDIKCGDKFGKAGEPYRHM